MATNIPPPILPSKEEEHLLTWLRGVARRDHISPALLTAQLITALHTMDAARRTSPVIPQSHHLGAWRSPQRHILLRLLFGLIIGMGAIVLCCLFAWVAGALIVASTSAMVTPIPSATPLPTGP